MKKLLIVLLVLFLLAASAVTLFIATFDANRYRTLITENLEKNLGQPVGLERVSLTWKGGLALSLDRLAVYPKSGEGSPPVLAIEHADAVLQLLPLLSKNVEIGTVKLVRPQVSLVRNSDGSILIGDLDLSGKPGKQEAAGAASLPFLVDRITVEKASVTFTDRLQQPPSTLTVHKIDLEIRNVSFVRPMDIEFQAAVLSADQNIKGSTRLHLPKPGGAARLEESSVQLNLASFDPRQLAGFLPQAREVFQGHPLEGQVTLQVDSFDLSPQGMQSLSARVKLSNGSFPLQPDLNPVRQLQAEASLQNNLLEIRQLDGNWSGAKIIGTAKVHHLTAKPVSVFDIQVKNLTMQEILRNPRPGDPALHGLLSTSFQGNAQGLAWPEISVTLSGSGRLAVDKPVLVNVNVLKEVFGKLSIIPGLVPKLQSRLSEEYRQKLEAKDTVLEPIDLPFSASGGVITLSQFRIAADTFEMTGVMNLGLNGAVQAQCMLRIDPELSKAIIASVNELAQLTDASGRLQIPLQIQGTYPAVAVLPNLQHVASQLVVQKAQEWIGGLIDKNRTQNTQTAPPAAGGTANTAPQTGTGSGQTQAPQQKPLETLLSGLLQSALNQNPSQDQK